MLKENWTYKKLGDCFPYIKNGANIKQERGASGIPITRIETLSGGVFNRDRLGYADIFELDKYLDYILSSHDLLMSHINSKAYIGRTVEYISKEQETIIHGMNLLRLKSNPEIINSSFFAYYTHCHIFKSEIAKIRKDAVNQSSFSISDLKKIFILVPPLETQSRIVSELDLLQSIIDKQQAQLKELDTLAQAVFYDMFGDPVENEKGWETKTLKDSVIEMFLGPFGSALKTDCYVDKEASYCIIYEQKHAIKKTMDVDTHYIDKAKFDSLKRFEVHSGDFIMSCRGTIGEIYRIPQDAPMGIIHPSLMKIRIREDVYHPTFFLWLLSRIIKNENTNGNCVQMAITAKELGTRKPILPPLSLQQSFAAKIESIEKQKAAISQSMAETQKLFDYTMDKYFG